VILYEFFWVLMCQWIMPYAFLTCRRQGAWITRGSTKALDVIPGTGSRRHDDSRGL
jgi:hypothetical protein